MKHGIQSSTSPLTSSKAATKTPAQILTQAPTLMTAGRIAIVYRRAALWLGIALLTVLLVLTLFSLKQGKLPLTMVDVMHLVLKPEEGGFKAKILWDIRLPRSLVAILVGASLGASGAVFQSLSRNALGSPDVIGFTTGAAAGALCQIILFDGGVIQTSIAAILGGVLTAMLVYLLANKWGTLGGYRLILTGIGVGAILTAFNGLLLVYGDLDDAMMASLWLAGSLNARTWWHVYPVAIGVILFIPLMSYYSRQLSVMEMGRETAIQLGVAVDRVTTATLFIAVALASLATAAAGPIAFVALAAPQLVARIVPNLGLSVLLSALMGALLLISADVFIRLLPLSASIPIGNVTGIIGGGYLMWLLMRLQLKGKS